MESGKILQSDYLDLIYDNRNKAYGGYELRKHYNRRAVKALSITCAVLLLGIGTPFLMSKLNAKEHLAINGTNETIVAMTELPVDLPKPPDAPKPLEDKPAAPPRTSATEAFADPKIVKNSPDVELPDTKELEHKLAGPVSSPGEEGEAIAMSKEKHAGPFGDGVTPDGDKDGNKPLTEDIPFRTVEVMPEFPGGMKALAEFIKSNLRYPAAAREDGIEGRVYITFIVNAQGEIESAEVARGIGGGCDKEALRVVNAMPRWKPGKQNGHAVKVYYTLPISFRLE